jgi:hypothetical protein
MYMLFSEQKVLSDLLKILDDHLVSMEYLDKTSIKKAYLEWLFTIQPSCPRMEEPQLFYSDMKTEKSFKRFFRNDLYLSPVNYGLYKEGFMDSRERKDALIESLSLLKEKNEGFHKLFNVVMNTVLCPVSRIVGGSSVNPRYIGVMCAHSDMSTCHSAHFELFYQEFARSIMFIDEHAGPYYLDYRKLRNPAYYVRGFYTEVPIRVPLNHAVQRLVVFCELLMVRDEITGHDIKAQGTVESVELLEMIKWYLREILDNQAVFALLSNKGREIFCQVARFASKYQLPESVSVPEDVEVK